LINLYIFVLNEASNIIKGVKQDYYNTNLRKALHESASTLIITKKICSVAQNLLVNPLVGELHFH